MIVLILFVLVVGLYVGLELTARVLRGPDPDLEGEPWDPAAEPMCRCGVRGGARRHVHGSWTDRAQR